MKAAVLSSANQALLQHNATTYVAGRTRSKAMAVIEELEESTGKTARFLEVDLGSIASVRAAAEEFMRWVCTQFNGASPTCSPVTNQDGAGAACPLQQCVCLIACYCNVDYGAQLTFASFSAINAMGSPKETLTVDGYDLQFGTNVIGAYSACGTYMVYAEARYYRALALHGAPDPCSQAWQGNVS